jgi:hypothetical protein
LNGASPKQIATAIYNISATRKRTVQNALLDAAWIRDIDIVRINSAVQLAEFTHLSGFGMCEVHQTRRIHYDISLRGTIPRITHFTYATPHLARLGATEMKFFAWLAFQNRLWTTDRLIERGWPNYTSLSQDGKITRIIL